VFVKNGCLSVLGICFDIFESLDGPMNSWHTNVNDVGSFLIWEPLLNFLVQSCMDCYHNLI